MEMKREAASNDVTESSHDDKPSIGMFGFSSLHSAGCLQVWRTWITWKSQGIL